MIIQHDSYDMESLRSLPDAFWAGMEGCNGKSVFIKPNLVTPPTRWDRASITHPNIARIVIEKAQEYGAKSIRIGDCGFKNQWAKTMALSGYGSMGQEYGVEMIPLQDGPNFHKFTLVRLEKYLSLYGAKFSDYVLECEFVISLPKLKVHSMAGVTGAIKNMMGCMAQKGSMHPKADPDILQKRLCDLYFLIRPMVKFCVLDGIVGSEYSEQCGIAKRANILASSTDPWELDCIAAEVMGIGAGNVPYLRYIAEQTSRKTQLTAKLPQKIRPVQFETALGWRKK